MLTLKPRLDPHTGREVLQVKPDRATFVHQLVKSASASESARADAESETAGVVAGSSADTNTAAVVVDTDAS